MEAKINLIDLPFALHIEEKGKLYAVGGAVRDELLGIESKDLDLIVTGIPMNELENLLSNYGKVDLVGKSFGVLKVKLDKFNQEIDVALPRIESPNGKGGHRGFDVKFDHNLTIEDDLSRRDFTINAIAKDINGNYIYFQDNLSDIKNKLIRVVNEKAFVDDPLRLLRGVCFAVRLDGFIIEEKTKNIIKSHAKSIKQIALERILMELKKVIDKKGDPLYCSDLLRETNLYREIFEYDSPAHDADHWDSDYWNEIRTFGEFMYMLLTPLYKVPDQVYLKMSGDVDTANEIKAIDFGNHYFYQDGDDIKFARINATGILFKAKSEKIFNSKLFPDIILEAFDEFKRGKYPKKVTELDIDGNDLIKLDYKGKDIGKTLDAILFHILCDRVKNNKEDLLKYIKKVLLKK